MVVQNRMDQLQFSKQQQTVLDILKNVLILKSITVFEHDHLCFGDAIFNDQPDLVMLRYNKEDKTFVSHNKLNNDIKIEVSKDVI